MKVGGAYGIRVVSGGIEVSVGLDAPLTITSVNQLGQQTDIFDASVLKGTYVFPLSNKGLQWVVAKQGDWVETIGIYVE